MHLQPAVFLAKGWEIVCKSLGYIPEAYNDMIFAVVCEELGIVGAAGLIIAFLVMFWRITWIAIKATDLFGTMNPVSEY